VTHTISKFAGAFLPTLAAVVLTSFSYVGVSSASVAGVTAKSDDQKPARVHRAKLAPKKHKLKATVPQAMQGAAMAVPTVSEETTNAPLALKPSYAVNPAAPEPVPAAQVSPAPQTNPYLVNASPPSMPPQTYGNAYAAGSPQGNSGLHFSLPQVPLFEQSILPKIQTVYPTGEKPLVVVTFKCPTELVGIDTPSTLILHKVVNGGMDLINKTNLLSFNMQQVCQ